MKEEIRGIIEQEEMVNYEKVDIVLLTTPGKILETLHGVNFLWVDVTMEISKFGICQIWAVYSASIITQMR